MYTKSFTPVIYANMCRNVGTDSIKGYINLLPCQASVKLHMNSTNKKKSNYNTAIACIGLHAETQAGRQTDKSKGNNHL
jgi:hypothetical protein